VKIAFVRKAYSPYGGAERYLGQLLERLSQQGHEIHVFAHRWEYEKEAVKGERTRILFHRVPMVSAPSFLEALSFAFFSKRLLQRENFDIIHSFERTLYQDIYRAGDGCHREWLVQRRKMDPWLKRLFHPLNPLHRSLLFLEKRLFQSPQLRKIIANSQRGKEEIIRHYGIPAEKIEVIHNGVDLQTFHPRNIALYRKPFREELGIQAQALVILFLGSGFRRKGLAPLLNAFCQVKKEIPGVFLIVVGKDRTEEYNKRARRMGAGREVLFLGPSKRAPELYAASDLFALPTFYDPFSNACLEAMATGIPVLTTLTNGVAELIEDQKNGFLIPDPTYVDEIAGKIKTFFYNRNRTSMGEKARESCSHLDMDSVLNRLIAIYEELKP